LRKIEVQDFVSAPAPVRLDKGEEMGRFKLGSTAIVLFRQSSDLEWEVKAGDAVKMGQEFAD
jgi:phosphatidylserine decarboxylase